MRIGLLSSSWPSRLRPWAGCFVAELGQALAARHEVVAVAPRWSGFGDLEEPPGVRLVPAPAPGAPGSLGVTASDGVLALAALWRAARRVNPDLWLCHWWPTALAARPGVPRVVVVHGSDLEWLERAPRPLALRLLRRLEGPGPVVAVGASLAHRLRALGATPRLCPLGAFSAERLPRGTSEPRLLTAARDVPGKGLAVARAARAALGGLPWEVVSGVHPARVRELIAGSDLVVVPNEDGPGSPKEGAPHIITQALAAGVPVLAGPNRSARAMACAAGQAEVEAPGPGNLARAVRASLIPARLDALGAAAAAGRAAHGWDAALVAWETVLESC
jgi:glycosyltransferase involved in cell wall biosynthesis